jgi:AraC family transcriptional regulator
MYFTRLPDHSVPGFDEQAHFDRFKKQNVIFNAFSPQSHCPNHVGCLSIKTILHGEEWYGIDNRRIAIRPGQFLILNNDQPYSCQIHRGEGAKVLSVFFEQTFAASVFHDRQNSEEQLLDNPEPNSKETPAFFQTLHPMDEPLNHQLTTLIKKLDTEGYDRSQTDEHLTFILQHLLNTHKKETSLKDQVNAVKASTKNELFKRLCIAKDILHSDFQQPLDISRLGKAACLSTPQLIRQFKTVFQQTPHQYLVAIRLQHAAQRLKTSTTPINDLAWQCGFNDPSAFCRAFRAAYGLSPHRYREARNTKSEAQDLP